MATAGPAVRVRDGPGRRPAGCTCSHPDDVGTPRCVSWRSATTASPTEHVVRMSVRVTSGAATGASMLALHLATGDDPLPAPLGAAAVHAV